MPYSFSAARPRRVFYGLLLLGLAASFFALGTVLVERFAVTSEVCREVNQLRATITVTLLRSERTLPTLSYYRHHPAELAASERQVATEIAQFHPVHC